MSNTSAAKSGSSAVRETTSVTPQTPSATPKTMVAMVQEKYGTGADVLESRQVSVPAPGAGQVLVKVHSSSVNALEWHLLNGKPYLFRPVFGLKPKRPVLGTDFSGTVIEVGPEVESFRVGDEVFGCSGAGAYAEYVATNLANVSLKPAGVSFEDAAAVGVAGLTALQGLRDIGQLKAGQNVLINGASGGVGTYAVQIAKVLGAEVTAVCSSRNADAAAVLGADHVVNYDVEDFTLTSERFDVIFDGPGNRSLFKCKKLLKPGGQYILVGGPKGNWLGPIMRILGAKLAFLNGEKKEASFTAATKADDLAILGSLLESKEIRSVIDDTFPLKNVAIPLDRQGKFHARGKTVVRVGGAV